MKDQTCTVGRAPHTYAIQGLSGCGGFSAKAILESFGKRVPPDPIELYPYFSRILHWGLPSAPVHWQHLFGRSGLVAQVHQLSSRSQTENVEVMKGYLRRGIPLMVRIGNGYLPNGRYAASLSWLIGHWVTVWGFDDKRECFYVYDSCVPSNRLDRSIPVGNVVRTYQDMLRDASRGGLPRRWRNTFISVEEHSR